jgi:K+-sensing histidine kinase KdpD
MRAPTFLKSPHFSSLRAHAIGVLLALLIVAVVTVLLAAASAWFPIEHVTIVYLIPVIVAALRWGAVPALFAGLAGVAAPAFFFYPPIYDFRVSSPAQIADIVLFVTVAAITGHMAATVRKAKMRAQAEGLRDALIGSVSHELHTPLAAIVGSASILAQSPAVAQDDDLSSLVRVVRKEADRLNSDIQNLLDATRISNDGIRPHLEWVDLEDVVNAALARKRQLLAGHEVVAAVADDLPLAFVDSSLIESALGQLLENAAKYSPAGTPISIGVTQEASTIQIKVTDQGAGLALGEHEKIFERFYRGTRHAGTVSGSGLGLWIARALIDACGGRVRAFSLGPGYGTTLRIDLPIRTPPAADEDADE